MKRLILLAALLPALSASAQRLRIAIHPLAAPGVDDPSLVRALDAETRDLLVGTGRITPVNADDVLAQLAGDGGKCSPPADQRLKCLERLALTTRAEYALAVELKKFGKSYELAATLVARNGEPIAQPEAIAITPPSEVKPITVFKAELKRLLLDRMKLATIAPVPTTAVSVPPPQVDLPPPLVPKLTEPEMSRLRKAAFLTGGLTVVLGAVAVGTAVSSNTEAAAIEKAARARGETAAPFTLTTSELDQARTLRAKHNTAQTLGAITAAAAVSTILLWALGSPPDAAPAIAPVPGGAVVSFGGAF